MTASLHPYISKFDEGFDVGKTLEYRLTIQFNLDGFSYVILDANTKTIIAMEFFLFEDSSDKKDVFPYIEKAFTQHDLNGKNFQSITCIIGDRCCALIPKELFDEKEPGTYLSFLHAIPQGHLFSHDVLDENGCINAYSISNELEQRIKENWPNANICHESSVFIKHVTRITNRNGAPAIYLNVKNRSFDLAIIERGKLSFFNNFKFNTKDDFLYFLLFAIQQQKLSVEETPVHVTGMILASSEIMKLCERYIKTLKFIETNSTISISKDLKEIPSQYYYIPYQVFRCES